ncbi:metallophosphoesterase [Neobacillus sp. 114]|uniref:metallophosphoesterase n=1 Tax=Neobacillus sp. 114 TaxID=3048535 RepID=UPI0024C341D6|nr:metallophosphoesterase [Neobacillus sp. 114]
MKARGKRLLSILLVIVVIMSSWGGGVSVYADNSANLETVAAWNMTTATEMSASIPATSGKNKDNALFSNSQGAVPTIGSYADTDSVYLGKWAGGMDGKYWQVELSTKGYEQLTVTGKVSSSPQGPRDFKVIYSTDGDNWKDIENSSYSTTTSYSPLNTLALPEEIQDKDKVFLRWIMTSNYKVNGDDGTTAMAGNTRINDIVIQGVKISPEGVIPPVDDTPPVDENPPADDTPPVDEIPEVDDSSYSWNINNGDLFNGQLYVTGASKKGNDNLSLTLDGNPIAGMTTDGNAYLDFRSSGIQSESNKFKNSTYINDQFNSYIPKDDVQQRLPLNLSLLTPGQVNSISIVIGNSAGDYNVNAAPNTTNYDDFSVFDFSISLPNGGKIVPTGVKLYYAVDPAIPASQSNQMSEEVYLDTNRYSMGDGFPGGSNLSLAYKIDILFDLTAWDNKVKLFSVDTTSLADGNHTIVLLDNGTPVKTATITTDNTAPVVEPSVTDGAMIRSTDGLKASITDETSGIASTLVKLDGTTISLPYDSVLTSGTHTLLITVTDKAGNTTTKTVSFEVDSAELSVTNPQTIRGENHADLLITPNVPGGGKADVTFYKAVNISDIHGYSNVMDSTNFQNKSYPGETVLEEKVGGYVTTTSESGMPYQAYDVNVGESTGKVVLSFTGHTQGSEKLALAVWNHKFEKWVKVTSGHGSKGSDFTLTAKVDTADFVSEGKLRAMIVPDLVSNGSDTIGWFTDTQYYTDTNFYAADDTYKKMTQWLANQYNQNKIGYVAHTGDLIQSVGNMAQWKISDAAHKILDDAKVPNGVVTGNHDVGDFTNLRYESSGYFSYFGEGRYAGQPWYGGSYNNNTHHYDLVTIGGKDLIMLYLGMGVEVTPDTVTWANSVLKEYSNRSAILLVHEYLATNGDFDKAQRGQQIFEKIIVPNNNVALVLSGHNPGVSRNTRTVPGASRFVQEIMSDYQDYNRGGDGFLRTLQLKDGKLINKTYSPVMDKYNAFSPEVDDFTVDLPLQNPNRIISTASFTAGVTEDVKIGNTVSVESGNIAATVWEPLASSDTGWFAEVTANGKTLITQVHPVSDSPIRVDANKVPQQLTMHVGTDASTSVNFAWTTNEKVQTLLKVNKKGGSPSTIFSGTNAVGAGNRFFHKVEVTGLTPGTEYEYTAGAGANTLTGTFKTAPEAGNKDSFTFNYIVDPQISNAVNSIAAGATFNELSKLTDSAFTYIGGDLTDSSSNETQWNLFFNNGGAYPTAGADFLKNNLISVVQGNHDNATFNGHINVPNQSGGAYAFDYGPVKYVMLNTQNDTQPELEAQEVLLRSEAGKAKENGQWIFVGMHKAIYTGASHITDNDIIELRKYWSPIFAELDIDVVMQGHDHVFSRGFINEQGVNAKPEMLDETTALQPDNVPFYMVALTAGGLKWYGEKNYTVTANDPLATNYQFLDKNSAKPVGDPLNPQGPQSDIEKETAYVTVTVAQDSVTFNTYAFKYDQTKNEITKLPYLYDTYTIKKKATAENPVNNAPTADDASFTIDEKTANGTVVGAVKASDADGDALTYKISSGNNEGTFAINEKTGEITVADATKLHAAAIAVYTLSILVSDGQHEKMITITINVLFSDVPHLQKEVLVTPVKAGDRATVSDDQINQLAEDGTLVVELKKSLDEVTTIQFTPGQLETLINRQAKIKIVKDDVELLVDAANFAKGENLVISIERVGKNPEKLPSSNLAAGAVYDFTIKQGDKIISNFAHEIQLAFPVSGVDHPEELKVFYWNPDKKVWELVGGTFENGQIKAMTKHLSTYGVFRPNDLVKANPSTDGQVQGTETENSSTEKQLPNTAINKKVHPSTEVQLPETATNMYNWLFAGIILLLMGGTILFKQRLKQKQ